MHFGPTQLKDSIALDEVINEEWQGMQKEHFLLLVMFCLGMKSCTHTHTRFVACSNIHVFRIVQVLIYLENNTVQLAIQFSFNQDADIQSINVYLVLIANQLYFAGLFRYWISNIISRIYDL